MHTHTHPAGLILCQFVPSAEHCEQHRVLKLRERGPRDRHVSLAANVEIHDVAGLGVVVRSDGGIAIEFGPIWWWWWGGGWVVDVGVSGWVPCVWM